LGLGGQPPPLQVVAHPAAARRPRHPPGCVAHDPVDKVDPNRKIGEPSALRQRARKTARRWDPSEAYRAAVSFNA
jgi:hypothetical protein